VAGSLNRPGPSHVKLFYTFRDISLFLSEARQRNLIPSKIPNNNNSNKYRSNSIESLLKVRHEIHSIIHIELGKVCAK
jgi:hypothetical protein